MTYFFHLFIYFVVFRQPNLHHRQAKDLVVLGLCVCGGRGWGFCAGRCILLCTLSTVTIRFLPRFSGSRNQM